MFWLFLWSRRVDSERIKNKRIPPVVVRCRPFQLEFGWHDKIKIFKKQQLKAKEGERTVGRSRSSWCCAQMLWVQQVAAKAARQNSLEVFVAVA